MTTVIATPDVQSRDSKLLLFAPVAAAFAYPFLLKAFHAAVAAAAGRASFAAGVLLLLAIGVPILGLLLASKLGQVEMPSASTILAKRLALLTVAAAPLFTASGVLLYMAGDPISDITLWVVLWSLVFVLMVKVSLSNSVASSGEFVPVSARLRVAHGIGAMAIVLLFLALHLINHMAGLIGEAEHRRLMDIFRVLYRAKVLEPIVVALFLFQVGSGIALLWGYTRQKADWFRTLQIASGAYLIFFVLGHMNSVFFYARTFADIPTDWNFATGAPTGLIRDAWNIRLLPHYLLGVFFVLTHLVLGARVVALAHGMDAAKANRLANVGIALAAVVAVAILSGMSGLRIA
ncbi:hypothetical protein [Acidovorax sp.]|uniref:hypothetical protein n=1 Tax=Acidovorax sp. TaxID=1872122 RepID=UPI002628A48A|nr:hypothetical protein [Acidovorax sp.]